MIIFKNINNNMTSEFIIYIILLLIISSIYNYLISLLITNYYIHNVSIVYLLLLQIDNIKLFKKIENNEKDEFDKYITIICNQSYEIQKYKLIIENMTRKNIIHKRYKSSESLNTL
jgi:hypothetical protein